MNYYKAKLINRKSIIDRETNKPYIRCQTEKEFCETVNKEMDELRNKGARNISVQYFQSLDTDTDREIIKAIITYMI